MFIAALFSLLTLTGTDALLSSSHIQETPVLVTEAELQLALRDLWTGHVFWVRSTILASHYDDEAAIRASETRVLSNARALADAVKPSIWRGGGRPALRIAGRSLRRHQGVHAGEFRPRPTGSEHGGEEGDGECREIADFLSAANPHLPKNAALPLLMAHGGHHMQQIEAIREGSFSREAEVWEAMLGDMYTIADAMASAIAKQFPNEFAD